MCRSAQYQQSHYPVNARVKISKMRLKTLTVDTGQLTLSKICRIIRWLIIEFLCTCIYYTTLIKNKNNLPPCLLFLSKIQVAKSQPQDS